MIPIKILCGCGQKYAFEIEPVGGRMPGPIACPVCGADGTTTANQIIAESLPTQTATTPAPAPVAPAIAPAPPTPPAPKPTGGLRIAHSAPAPQATATAGPAVSAPAAPSGRPPVRLPGQVSPDQALHEAKAKISWGDTQQTVTGYLLGQGFPYEEAARIVKQMFDERASTIRKTGFVRIFTGIGMASVPVIGLLIFLAMGYIPVKILAVLVMIGLYGVWTLIRGIFMVISPRTESGDVADK